MKNFILKKNQRKKNNSNTEWNSNQIERINIFIIEKNEKMHSTFQANQIKIVSFVFFSFSLLFCSFDCSFISFLFNFSFSLIRNIENFFQIHFQSTHSSKYHLIRGVIFYQKQSIFLKFFKNRIWDTIFTQNHFKSIWIIK